jgi:hypothetical protein
MAKPKTFEPWDVLPIEPKGDDTADEIYLAVGKALTTWERLDDTLGMIFGTIVRSEKGAASAAYGVVLSPASRAEMIVAAAEQTFSINDPLALQIVKLVNDVGRLAGRRNDIAHGVVTSFSETRLEEGGGKTEVEHGHYLVPANYNRRKKRSKKAIRDYLIEHGMNFYPHLFHKYAYTSAQIYTYITHFDHYRQSAWATLTQLSEIARSEELQELLQEQASTQRIQTLETKLKALEPKSQRKPSRASPRKRPKAKKNE